MPRTERECIAALREAADRLGESPTKAEYEELGLQPASATIMRVLGGWNDAKEAAGLETYEQGARAGSDVQPKPDDVEIPDDAEWEELSGNMRWYYRNRERDIERKNRRRRELRRWLYERKSDRECDRCGESDPLCLDFHHVDETEKEMNVSNMINYGYSREKIEAEMAKCVLICANCHRKEHFEPPSPVDDG